MFGVGMVHARHLFLVCAMLDSCVAEYIPAYNKTNKQTCRKAFIEFRRTFSARNVYKLPRVYGGCELITDAACCPAACTT